MGVPVAKKKWTPHVVRASATKACWNTGLEFRWHVAIGWHVAVDFETDTDFNQNRCRPDHVYPPLDLGKNSRAEQHEKASRDRKFRRTQAQLVFTILYVPFLWPTSCWVPS
jgi:hypothetical protein